MDIDGLLNGVKTVHRVGQDEANIGEQQCHTMGCLSTQNRLCWWLFETDRSQLLFVTAFSGRTFFAPVMIS